MLTTAAALLQTILKLPYPVILLILHKLFNKMINSWAIQIALISLSNAPCSFFCFCFFVYCSSFHWGSWAINTVAHMTEQKRTASTSCTEQLKSQSVDWELDTVNSSPTSTDWKFPTQMNVHAARVLKPPTTSCSPAPPSTLWDTRHGPVLWMPTGSCGDRLRYCGRLGTLPYSPDWTSSMAGNTEEDMTEMSHA